MSNDLIKEARERMMNGTARPIPGPSPLCSMMYRYDPEDSGFASDWTEYYYMSPDAFTDVKPIDFDNPEEVNKLRRNLDPHYILYQFYNPDVDLSEVNIGSTESHQSEPSYEDTDTIIPTLDNEDTNNKVNILSRFRRAFKK